jgi:BirA family biotin operon repressor/biotin-[acetyl-CoA-carboxylase] ligase
LALLESVKIYYPEVKLKWPNDLYAGDRKLAGILVQNVLRGQNIRATVVGIGLNVNEIQFPKELPNPVSLAQITGCFLEIPLVRRQLSKKLEQYYLLLKRGGYEELMAAYESHLYRLNEEALFTDETNRTFAGTIAGVDEQGRLQIVHTVTGQSKSYQFREIRYVI